MIPNLPPLAAAATIPLDAAILPHEMLDLIEDANADAALPKKRRELLSKEAAVEEVREQRMLATAELLMNVMLQAGKSLKAMHLKEFDANPGDAGCQLRGLRIRELSLSEEVHGELAALVTKAEQIRQELNKRKSAAQRKESALDFYKRMIAPLTVTKEAAYLLECRLLFALKQEHRVQDNGVIVTKTNPSKLLSFSNKLSIYHSDLHSKLVSDLQAKVSEESVAYIQDQAAAISTLPAEEKTLLIKMLAPERIHRPTVAGYAPKAFSCAFYNMKAVLQRLREEQALVAIKSIVHKGQQPFHILLRPPASGAEFQLLSDAERKSLINEPVEVIEGVVAPELSPEDLAQKVAKIGLSKLVLACTAQTSPYEPGSSLSSIDLEEAKAEIAQHCKLAHQFDCDNDRHPIFLIDHFYANSLTAEKIL